ncbi:MAG: hypothetical protein EHM72_07650, partial [Calditrichaeota bacterium]
MNRFILLSMLLFLISCRSPNRHAGAHMPHLEKRGSAVQLMVHEQPFIMLAGELHNSSASSADYLEKVWQKLNSINLNTVIAPVYWELFEPAEGQFDFTLIDSLINGARRHHLKLVLLWFGTWKNTESSYVPVWVKGDQERFFRVQNSDGTHREIISPFCRAACQADAHAFSQLMRHLEQRDNVEHTVLMVQIENEVGLLGEPRDVCPQAESAFRQSVPDSIMALFTNHLNDLHPELRESWTSHGSKSTGSWAEVFDGDAAEFFMAWALADYIDRIAAVGKSIYPLPMFVNAWLRSPGQVAGQYPSGGPIDKVHDIWKLTAPHLDFFAPDIYLPNFKQICADYTRNDNPLLIPEAHRNDHSIAPAMYALTQHNAMGFSPFGIDG